MLGLSVFAVALGASQKVPTAMDIANSAFCTTHHSVLVSVFVWSWSASTFGLPVYWPFLPFQTLESLEYFAPSSNQRHTGLDQVVFFGAINSVAP